MATTIERFEKMERAGDLHLKGYKYSEIARELDVTPQHAKHLITEYKDYVRGRVQEDPDFLDRLQENTMEMLDAFDMLIREAWENYETAKNAEMLNQATNLIKVIGDLQDRKSKLLQLMGVKVDGGMMARMQKAEQVNDIVSGVIRDVVGECPRCRTEAQVRLAQAFSLMNKADEAAEMELVAATDGDIVDAEVIDGDEEEMDEEQLADLLTEVVNK